MKAKCISGERCSEGCVVGTTCRLDSRYTPQQDDTINTDAMGQPVDTEWGPVRDIEILDDVRRSPATAQDNAELSEGILRRLMLQLNLVRLDSTTDSTYHWMEIEATEVTLSGDEWLYLKRLRDG